MSKDPVVITVDLDDDRSISEQMDTPENREAIEGVVRNAIGDPPPSDGFWGEVPTGPAEPIAFQTARKDLLHALTRTQHAHSGDEARPVLQSWWLTVEPGTLTIHAADNYRLARVTIDITSTSDGWFGIHRSEGKALLAFLASGPSDVTFDASGGAWSVRHEDGMLTGRLSPGTPPDWRAITDAATPSDAIRFALNGRYASDAAKAATGASGIALVDYAAADRPTHWHSDGYDEWVMPVRIGGSEL
jgi:hypothetical protein